MGSLIKHRSTQEKIEKGFEYKVSVGSCIMCRHNCVVLVSYSPGPH